MSFAVIESVESRVMFSGGIAVSVPGFVLGEPVVPGSAFKTTISANSAVAAKGSGVLRGMISYDGAAAVELFAVPVKLALKAGVTSNIPVTLKVDAPLPPGSGTVTVVFVADAKSAIKSEDVVAGLQNGLVLVETVNTATVGRALTFADADGTVATMTVSGPGSAAVTKNEDGTLDLLVTGSTDKTTVSVALAKGQAAGNDGRLNLHGISVAGNIGAVNASVVDVSGTITFTGAVATAAFGNDLTGQFVSLPTAPVTANLSFLAVRDLTIHSGQAIGSFSVSSWLNTDSSPDVMSVPSIAKLTSAGNFQTNVIAAGSLGSAKIGGDLGGNINVATVGSLTVVGTFGVEGATDAGRVGLYAATSIGTVVVGSMKSADIFAGVLSSGPPTSAGSFNSGHSTITSVKLSGKSSVFSDSNIGAEKLGTIVLAGVAATGDAEFGVVTTSVASYTRGKTKVTKRVANGVFDSAGLYSAAIVGS